MSESEPIIIYEKGERFDTSPLGPGPNWVTHTDPAEGLGPYIRAVAHALMRAGHSEQDAIQMAIGVIKKWAHGGQTWGHKSHASPATIAKAQAAVAHWEALKAKAHSGSRSEITIEKGTSTRDGMGGFVGESGASGAANFLPAGPSAKQDEEIHEKQEEKPHRFSGSDLSSCDACGAPITAAIHRTTPTAPGQPIPPVPREATLLRSRGPDHSSVPSGQVGGNPLQHKRAAYAANQKNFAQAEPELDAAMKSHFSEQRRATVNRLLGKRGGRMLKRAAEDRDRLLLESLGSTYAKPKPPMFPEQGDLSTTTAEPNTTAPLAEPDFASEIAAEKAQAKTLHADVQPPHVVPDINPQDVFDENFWANKLADVLRPHITTASTMAHGAVRTQVGLPSEVDDSRAIAASHANMEQRAGTAARAITNTTARELTVALQAGVARGEDREAIAQRIHTVFDHANSNRAPQIAQTQTIGAYNEAGTTYASNLPVGSVGNKAWLAHQDGNTRPTHTVTDGQERPLGTPYLVGASVMNFPGDLRAPIHEWINCRCSQAFLPPGMTYGPIVKVAKSYSEAWHEAAPVPVTPYLGTNH